MATNILGLNQTFPIYNSDGTSFHDLTIKQASVESAVMSLGDKISGDVFYKDNTLSVTMGEYIIYNDVKYVLVNPPTIVRNGMVDDNGETHGMTKYSFVFYHPMYMLSNFPFTDIAVTQDQESHLSQNKTFSWIGNLFDFIDKLNKNLEHTNWSVSTNITATSEVEWKKAHKLSEVLSFDKNFISDALKTAYETWEIPFIISNKQKDEEHYLYRYTNDFENFTEVSQEALDNVPTLGRNLLLKSNVTHTSQEYHLCSYDFGQLRIDEGQDVVITIHGTLGSDRAYFALFNSTPDCAVGRTSHGTEIDENTWVVKTRWTKVNPISQQIVSNDKLLVYQYYEDGTSTSTIEWIKVEIGTERTNFTIAPEEWLVGTTEGKYIGSKRRSDADEQVVYEFALYNWTHNKPFDIVFGMPNEEILDEDDHPFVFRFGKGVGLKNNSRTPRNNKIVTRIVGYGAERNVPYGYPQIIWEGDEDAQYTIGDSAGLYENVDLMKDGVVVKHLDRAMSYPIYDGIVGGRRVRLIKHPFTRTTLMPSVYANTVDKKVNPFNEDYDIDTEIIDYYDADQSYPNPIIADAPSTEIHQFEDEYPHLGEAAIVTATPYDQNGEYRTYIQWHEYLDGRIESLTSDGWQKEMLVNLKEMTTASQETDLIVAGKREWNTGTGEDDTTTTTTAIIEVVVKDSFAYAKIVSSWYNETYKILQKGIDVPIPVWDDTMNDDGEYIQSYFEIELPTLSFDLYACAAITEEMKINMRSGACIGCTFPVQVDWEDYKKNFYDDEGRFSPDGAQRDLTKYPKSNEGQITILVQKETETFGTLMPNIYQQPKQGDSFVILGISLPLSYITAAQESLDATMKEYMLENNVYYYDYPLTFDEYFLATHTNILAQMQNNKLVRFQYADTEMGLYIKQINVKFGSKVLPEYEITLTDDVEVVLNRIGQVTDDVSRMRVQVSELQKYYTENLIRTIESKLSRIEDDVCQGRITFQQGLDAIGAVIFHDKLQSPEFNEGLYTGKGWRIDNLGNSEFESVRVRSFLEVVELLVNRLQAQEGETIFTDNDQIEKVDEVIGENNNVSYVLTLKEKYQGYVTTQQYGNVIKGIINTLAAEQSGIVPYTDNAPLYYTSWMRVVDTHTTQPTALGVNQIRVVLYGDNDVPSERNFAPCELMTIARWGNTLDPNESGISANEKARRRALRSTFYISTNEGHIAKLVDVHQPKLEDSNYGTTLGELPDVIKQYTSVAPRLADGRDYLFAQGIVVEDLIKITRNGTPIYEYVDCGLWVNGATTTPSVGKGIYLFEEFNNETGQYETHGVWHNNAKWRVLQHQPVTIGGVDTYYEPTDANSDYWQKLEGAESGRTLEVKWSDAFGNIDNIPCYANGAAKFKQGGGVDTWLTATLYLREGQSAAMPHVVPYIVLHTYDLTGTEIINEVFPKVVTNNSGISLDNYESTSGAHTRYLVEFKDAEQGNVLASASITRNLDGTDGDDGMSVMSYTLLPSNTTINVGRDNNNDYSPSSFTLRCGYRREYKGNVKVVEDVTTRIDGKYNVYYRKKLRTNDTWQTTYYKYTYYKDNATQDYTLTNVSVALFTEVEFILCTNTENEVSASNVTGLYTTSNVPVVVQGTNGERGKIGRFFYYAGEFDETDTTQTFVINDAQAPYFLTNKAQNTFHVFNYDTNGAYTMAQMYAIEPDFNNLPWEIMTNDFKYLITSAIFASNAKLGSFVISGDWLLSTNGTINGVAYNNGALYNNSPAYTWFDPQYPNESVNTEHSVNGKEWTGYNFVPNFAVDGLTGKSYQHDGYFDGTIKSANAEITGTVTANEGKIGPFTIGNVGLKVGDADNWKTSNNNFAYMHESALRIGQVERYNENDIAWIKVLFGRESDPNVNTAEYFCDTAMYIYRRMAAAHNDYEPAVKIYSDNLGNIDVAMRLKGALQVQNGGVIEQGRYLAYTGSGSVNTLNLTKGTTFVINNQTTSVAYFYLPTLSEVLTQLGMTSGTPFAIPITITAHRSSFDFVIRTTEGQNEFIYNNDGEKVNVREDSWSYLDMWKGDVVRLILTYDGTTYYLQMAGHFT